MKPAVYQGQLKTWKDDRGFGFIAPQDGSKEVFLHITALKGASRRPQVGDTILYERVVEANGKIRASTASIQGVPVRSAVTYQRSKQGHAPNRTFTNNRKAKETKSIKAIIKLGVFGTVLVIGIFQNLTSSRTARLPEPLTPLTESVKPLTQSACTVKGNISVSTGRKLYHVPGMEDYETTVIDPIEGERWFCTESEAIASGWQRAPR